MRAFSFLHYLLLASSCTSCPLLTSFVYVAIAVFGDHVTMNIITGLRFNSLAFVVDLDSVVERKIEVRDRFMSCL